MRRYVHESLVSTPPEALFHAITDLARKQAAGAPAQTAAFVRYAEGLR